MGPGPGREHPGGSLALIPRTLTPGFPAPSPPVPCSLAMPAETAPPTTLISGEFPGPSTLPDGGRGWGAPRRLPGDHRLGHVFWGVLAPGVGCGSGSFFGFPDCLLSQFLFPFNVNL